MEEKLIAYLRLFKPVSDADKEIILEYFTAKHFKEGELLIKPGKVAREMFFIGKGVLRIGSVNDKGAELTHHLYNENHLISILQSFNEEIVTNAFIQASCHADVLSITKNSLLDLYHKLPYMKELIDQQNQLQLIEKVNMHNAFLGEDAENRYKMFVKQFPDMLLRIPLKDIASFLGITQQSLSRIRKNIN